jgi:hypothetical protein
MALNIISERMLACHESWNGRKVHFNKVRHNKQAQAEAI